MHRTHPDYVPNAALREAVESSSVPLAQLARAIGMTVVDRRGYVVADSYRLKRALGMVHMQSHLCEDGTYKRYPNRMIHVKWAYQLMDALGLDPVDVDL
jgi:hypothetical protein